MSGRGRINVRRGRRTRCHQTKCGSSRRMSRGVRQMSGIIGSGRRKREEESKVEEAKE